MAASTFSYAQAAKGMSTPIASSKPTSGTVTPAKETIPATVNGALGSVQSWADDAEIESQTEQSVPIPEPQPQEPPSTSAQPIQSMETSSISSPDLGASSASTVTKDDDVSSLPNASSESTWDNKSQASTSVDKSVEPVEKTLEKVKKGKNAVVKPLHEAPLPAVNIWQKRADELKSKTQKPGPSPLPNGSHQASASASAKKGDSETKGQSTTGIGKSKNYDEEKSVHGRKEVRLEADSKKDSKAKPFDRDTKSTANTQPPPPKRDQESWPTPETVINADRKKAQEKGEKAEKEQKESISTGAHGKHEWVKVPYTPSVVFSTPLPSAGNSRRGGRPGGRGGPQSGSRSTAFGANGASQSEKDGSATSMANGDLAKRERTEGVSPRDTSPKSKRTGSTTSPTLKEQAPATTTDKPSKAHGGPASDAETRPRTASSVTDAIHAPNQSGSFSRPYPNRPNKPRRGDMSFAGDRRRDGEASPTKDNTFDDRRTSVTTQTEGSGDSERRASTYIDGPNGHQPKQGRYSAYSNGRERGRGGARGGRANYGNSHQYSNGHMSVQSSPSFSIGPRSPTTFNPENPSFFAAPQGKYGRNGHRSQSVTQDPYRFAPYQAGPQVPPLQTYNMYDYGVIQQPMSAVPYNPYLDQYTLLSMLTTQVEYYFSVDNLLKDMYLRKKMDSQGFVTLEFIAGFNRIKNLSTDIELIKLVCQQSSVVQYRTGEDGQDRLRRREGWEQWVLSMGERDAVAQNDGPKELHQPPIPHPSGFDQSNPVQWPMSAVEPTGFYGSNASFPQMNGYNLGVTQDNVSATDGPPNSGAFEGSNEGIVPNEHPIGASTKAVSPESDSFPDAHIANLAVIVRKQDHFESFSVTSLTSRTFSNCSVDSNYDVREVPERMIECQPRHYGTSSPER
ncbi:hypothetical protein GQ44DRAFT_809245 [Phaeosphaeriaceae sp. PMI808]|nr:hypothetical protein GQ44DRAFT_809245 [Phaeosphaeriaceae sp. PMI808]